MNKKEVVKTCFNNLIRLSAGNSLGLENSKDKAAPFESF